MPATEVINIRLSAPQKGLITRAARLLGRSSSAFILENVLPAAQKCLMEQTRFTLTEEQWDAFTAALDAPPAPNQALERLLATPAPWESQNEA